MTRGNQRDLARQKNQKKKTELTKGLRTDNLTVEQRKARDADVMREKQKKKDEAAAARGGGGGSGSGSGGESSCPSAK